MIGPVALMLIGAVVAQPAAAPIVLRCVQVRSCAPGPALSYCRDLCAGCDYCPAPGEGAATMVGCPRPDRDAYCLGDGDSGWCPAVLGCSGCPGKAGNMGGVAIAGEGGRGMGVAERDNPFELAPIVGPTLRPWPARARVKRQQGSSEGAFEPPSAPAPKRAGNPTMPADLVLTFAAGERRVSFIMARTTAGVARETDPATGRIYLTIRPGDRDRQYLAELTATGVTCWHPECGSVEWETYWASARIVLPSPTPELVLTARKAMLEAWAGKWTDRSRLPTGADLEAIAEAAAGLWQSGSGAIAWRANDWPDSPPESKPEPPAESKPGPGRESNGRAVLHLLPEG